MSRKAIWFFVLPLEATFRTLEYTLPVFTRTILTRQNAIGSPWLYANAILGGVMLIFMWPIFVILAKRLHDLRLTGFIAAPYFLPLLTAVIVASSVAIGFGLGQESLYRYGLLSRSAGEVYVAVLILVLAAVKGQRGQNRFGADPQGYAMDSVF